MNKLSRGICPRCEGEVEELFRRPWMVLFIFSHYYRCTRCRHRYLKIWAFLTIKLGFHIA